MYQSQVVIIICLLLSSCSLLHKRDSFTGTLRLGYLLNMTHAVPIVGVERKAFGEIESRFFVAGGYLIDGFLTGNIDLAYLGPGPYINALNRGVKLRLLSQSAVGGNSFIVRANYDPAKPYRLKRLAIPQYGNTQDLLAKILINKLKDHNDRIDSLHPHMQAVAASTCLRLDRDFQYVPVNPAELETAFYINAIDSALVAEPWGTALSKKGLVDLTSLLASGPVSLADELEGVVDSTLRKQLAYINQFPTTILVVREEFYQEHPDLVDKFVQDQNNVLEFIRANPHEAITLIKNHLEANTKKKFEYDFLAESFSKIRFTDRLSNEKFNELAAAGYRAKYSRAPLKFEFTRT